MVRRGYTTRIDRNGVIVARPKGIRLRFPFKGLVLLALGFFCFKALMLAANGPQAYEDRVATLAAGNAVEAAGAKALMIDPVTQWIADQIGPYLP